MTSVVICRRTVFGRGSGNQSVKSLTDVASLLQSEAVKNVVVVAGAGISTPSGIPDFRCVCLEMIGFY